MSKIIDSDFSIQMACKLLNSSFLLDTCPESKSLLVSAVDDDLRFSLDFINGELERYAKSPDDKASFNDALMDLEFMNEIVRPLKILRSGILSVLNAIDLDKRNASLKILLSETKGIEEDVNTRIEMIGRKFPHLVQKRKSGCSGFMPADDVLHRIQQDRKIEQNKIKQKA